MQVNVVWFSRSFTTNSSIVDLGVIRLTEFKLVLVYSITFAKRTTVYIQEMEEFLTRVDLKIQTVFVTLMAFSS